MRVRTDMRKQVAAVAEGAEGGAAAAAAGEDRSNTGTVVQRAALTVTGLALGLCGAAVQQQGPVGGEAAAVLGLEQQQQLAAEGAQSRASKKSAEKSAEKSVGGSVGGSPKLVRKTSLRGSVLVDSQEKSLSVTEALKVQQAVFDSVHLGSVSRKALEDALDEVKRIQQNYVMAKDRTAYGEYVSHVRLTQLKDVDFNDAQVQTLLRIGRREVELRYAVTEAQQAMKEMDSEDAKARYAKCCQDHQLASARVKQFVLADTFKVGNATRLIKGLVTARRHAVRELSKEDVEWLTEQENAPQECGGPRPLAHREYFDTLEDRVRADFHKLGDLLTSLIPFNNENVLGSMRKNLEGVASTGLAFVIGLDEYAGPVRKLLEEDHQLGSCLRSADFALKHNH